MHLLLPTFALISLAIPFRNGCIDPLRPMKDSLL